MKKSIFIYLPFFLLSAVASFAQNNLNRLIPIPTPAHDFEIEVYFPGATPKRPNIKIEILEAYTETETTYGRLIKMLQAQAQKIGADAVVLMERERSSYFDAEFGIYQVTDYLSAIAIKYTENINYLHKYKKTKTTYTYNNKKGVYEFSNKTYYNPMEVVDSIQGKKTFEDHISERSTQHLVFEVSKDWSSYLGSKGYQVRSYKSGQKRAYHTIKNNRIGTIHFKIRGKHDWATIAIEWNEAKKEKERYITYEDRIERERYFYDDKKRLWKIEVSKRMNGQEEFPYFKVEYDFYKNEDLDAIIKQLEEPFFFKNMEK